jgi:FixJ family two-component response regulator
MKTIMVVDDEKNVLDSVKLSLEQEDYKVITLESRRKAIEYIEEEKEDNLELILIDTSMPDTRKPALFSLRHWHKANIDTTKKEDFLQKPFSDEQLIKFVKSKINPK